MADTALRRSPSPWSRFLSPSLFSQRSTPGVGSAGVIAPSPLKESTVVPPHQPGLFTHAKEINPFERSFAVLDPDPTPAVIDYEARLGLSGLQGDADEAMRGPGKRKRAMSSPAVLTPGGSALHAYGGAGGDGGSLAEFIQKAKRPTLHMRNQDSGVAMLDARDFVPASYSVRSSANGSFDSTTGSSVLRRRRGVSLSESPDTSVVASPPSPKLGPSPAGNSSAAPSRPASSNFSHFQAQPMPFSMPIVPSSTAFAQASIYPSAPDSVAASIAPDAVAPPASYPFMSGPPHVASHVGPTPFVPHAAPSQPHGVPFASGPLPQQAIPPPQPFFDPAFAAAAAAAGAVGPGPHGHPPFDPAFAAHHAAMHGANVAYMPQAYSGYPTIPAPPPGAPTALLSHGMPGPPPPPPPQPSSMLQSVNGKGPIASGSVAAASMSPVSTANHSSVSAATVVTPASDRDSMTPAPVKAPTGKKRGRKPKNWDPELEKTVELDPEEQEKQRKLALERNRVAASKSRRRKKERVELLENAASDLCSRNVALQAECRTLLSEVHALRTYMTQAHPQGACSCQHINGYLAREAEGGGIPAILYGAGSTLERDYSHPPKWGSEDDAVADALEMKTLKAVSKGNKMRDVPTMLKNGEIAPKGNKKAQRESAASPKKDGQSRDLRVDEVQPVGSRAKGAIPLRSGNASPKAKRPGMATRQSSSIIVIPEESSDEDDHDDDDEEESEAENIALTSRRARAIPLRKAT